MQKKYIYVSVLLMSLLVAMIVILTVVLLFAGTESNVLKNKEKIVIDHDGGADDAMAILIALFNEKYFNGPKVLALTTTFGNVNETQAFINSQRILRLANRTDVPIYRGSTEAFIYGIETDYYYGHDGLGDNEFEEFELTEAMPEHASLGLIEMSKKHEDDLTVISLGAATNTALAMKLDPGFIERISHLYIGAGTIHSVIFPDAEFNAAMDPEAYYMITKHANPDKVTVVPFSRVYATLNITEEWRQSVLGAIPTSTMEALNAFERISQANSTEWIQLDPVVMTIALHDNIVNEFKYSRNGIILCGNERGINTNYITDTIEGSNVKLFYSAIKEVYMEFLFSLFSMELT